MNMNTEDNLVVDKTENERNKKLKKMDSHLE